MDSSWLQFEARIVARRPRLEIALSGDLDVLFVQELRPIALGLAEAEQQDVLLDLADVAFIDVAGAHGLKDLTEAALAAGCRVRIRNASDPVRRVLQAVEEDILAYDVGDEPSDT